MNIFPEILFWMGGSLIFWFTLLFIFKSATQVQSNYTATSFGKNYSQNRVTCKIAAEDNLCSTTETTIELSNEIMPYLKKSYTKSKIKKLEDLILMIIARRIYDFNSKCINNGSSHKIL